MPKTQYYLLKTRRFLPLFLTQFLGAFNDNVFKNALVLLITFKIAQTQGYEQFMIALTAGIFILPFFLFSATAGQLADKYEKSIMIRIIKVFEITLMIIAMIGFLLNNLYLLMLALFLIGTHSAFFGPLKYAILPEHLSVKELLGGNALVESGTFIAILTGTIFGGKYIVHDNGTILISVALLLIAISGFISSLFIPKTISAQPELKVNWNIFSETWKIIRYAKLNRKIYLAILGISWFWLVGATFLTQFPVFTKNVISGNADIVTMFFTIFSLGIAIGSLICNTLLKGEISARFVPISIFGMSLFIIDLVLASSAHVHTLTMVNFYDFFHSLNNFRIALDVLLLSICGGMFIVPLYSIMQHEAPERHRARIIASNNILNALFMVLSAVGVMILYTIKLSITQVFLVMAIINIMVAFFSCKLLPHAVIQSFVKWILRVLYKVRVQGLEHYKAAGSRTVIVANHTSFLDAILLAAFLPDQVIFAINTQIARKWWMQPILKFIPHFLVDPTNPLAIKSLIKIVRDNHRCVIFPEGRITVTGALMKIYEGPGMIADQAKAKLLPIRIEGAQYTPFSRLRGKVKLHWFPQITLTIQPACTFNVPDNLHGRQRRKYIGRKLYQIMTDLIFRSSTYNETLFSSLLFAQKKHGKKHFIIEDIDRTAINYRQLILRSFLLGRKIFQQTGQHKHIGILLPNTISNVIAFFALQAFHRVPAMLNYSAGASNVMSACRASDVKVIITSHKFIELASLNDMIAQLQAEGVTFFYLEELKQKINLADKLIAYFANLFPHTFYKYTAKIKSDPHHPAIILFTSGTEGLPKGVVLSHSNLQANRFQISACIDFTAQDVIFNALPMFHAFGLNTATLLPILSGMKTFLHPSPLHYRIIPELIYDHNATITFGTDTFLRNYAKCANPYDFYSLRYVLAGAEKLQQQTRDLWVNKFGIRILEGYGTTETSPVLSINTAMQYKEGSVGKFLPGIEHKLEPIVGVSNGGRLLVKGPNVMLGYLLVSEPGKLQPLPDGWYDTGDIVHIDDEGYIFILGRAKRFAKIAGEMVSLSAIENLLSELWPDYHHAVITIVDEKKGEQLILVTTHPAVNREQIISYARQKKFSEIAIPKKIVHSPQIPLLSTGKIDYQNLQLIYGEFTKE